MSGGNKAAAARLIGVDRKVLDRRWERRDDPPSSGNRRGGTGSDDE